MRCVSQSTDRSKVHLIPLGGRLAKLRADKPESKYDFRQWPIGLRRKSCSCELCKRKHKERDYPPNSTLKMSSRMVTERLQINWQARRTDQQSPDQIPVFSIIASARCIGCRSKSYLYPYIENQWVDWQPELISSAYPVAVPGFEPRTSDMRGERVTTRVDLICRTTIKTNTTSNMHITLYKFVCLSLDFPDVDTALLLPCVNDGNETPCALNGLKNILGLRWSQFFTVSWQILTTMTNLNDSSKMFVHGAVQIAQLLFMSLRNHFQMQYKRKHVKKPALPRISHRHQGDMTRNKRQPLNMNSAPMVNVE
ncbi:hypothetical protein CLF_110586 [Clonorchis sinensis]|uniref:Uncharacterized protein n=1 Tax=Clonorchis sinensis TaxID=79923 RepID=G7YKW3_CLOSI|nr:hypothetical protein CLF_110586 [Clonorchis sinensis]